MDSALFPIVGEDELRLPVYLTSVGHWNHQEPVRRPCGFPDYQWLYAVSGEGELEVGERTLPVKAGQSFFLFPHIPHRYHSVRSHWELYWVSFGGGIAADLLGQAGIGKCGVYAAAETELAAMHFRGLIHQVQSPTHPFIGLEHSKKMYDLLLDLRKIVPDDASSFRRNVSRLGPVIALIESQLHRPIAIAELSDTIGTSPQHLCTMFRRTFGIRPMEYVNRERIKRSKELMFHEGGTPIWEIAKRVGMDNPSYFGTVFKRLEGMSPQQFKILHGLKV